MVADQLRSSSVQASWAHDPVRWANDVLGVDLWSKQQDVLTSVRDNKKTVVTSCHGTGKALALTETVWTPGGPVRMGDVEVGDWVTGSDGSPVRVVATTPVHTPEMFRVWLRGDEGDFAVVCSGDHLWPVLHAHRLGDIRLVSSRLNSEPVWWAWHHRADVMDTRALAKVRDVGYGALIPAAVPLAGGQAVPQWLAAMVAERGMSDFWGRASVRWVTHKQGETPEEFLAVRERARAEGVHVLRTRRLSYFERSWELGVPGGTATALLEAEQRALAWTARHGGREERGGFEVVRVEPMGAGVAAKCIQVDADDHLYLCGDGKVPTHNSMIASVVACWWVATKPLGDAIVVSTAPTYAQVNKILWEEIRKHHATAKQRGMPLPGYVTQGDEWKAEDGRILGFGRKPATGDRHGFHGIHRRFVLAVGDEACGLPEEIWTGIEAITTTPLCRQLYIGNPDDRNTEFGKVFLRPELEQDWSRIKISAFDTPNFTQEEVPELLYEVLVSKEWADSRLRDWGAKDPRYISKVLGEFPLESMSSLISPSLVAQAFEEVPEWTKGGILRIGVDVARFGTDDTVVVAAIGRTAKYVDSWSGTDTTSSAYRVMQIAEDLKERYGCAWVEIRVDAVGLGAGVVDTLNARLVLLESPWFTVYEMHGAASPPLEHGGSVHGYGNARAWWFDQLRTSIRNNSVKIVENQRMQDDLGMIFYGIRSGKLYIMSKEEMRSKHGRSPDFADALVYAVSPVPEGLIDGTVYSPTAREVLEDIALDEWEDEREMMIAPF